MKSEELIRRKTRFGIDRYSIVQGRKIGGFFVSDQLATGRENVIEKRIAGRPVRLRRSWAFRRVDSRRTGYFSWYGGMWVAKKELEEVFYFVEAKPVLVSTTPLYTGPISFEANRKNVRFNINLFELGVRSRHIFKISGAPNEADNGYKQVVTVWKGAESQVKFKTKFAGNSDSGTTVEIPNQLLTDNLTLFGDYVWFATRFALYRGEFIEENLVQNISKVSGVPQHDDTSEFYPNHIFRCSIYKEGNKYVMLTEERRTRDQLGAMIKRYESWNLENWSFGGYVLKEDKVLKSVSAFPNPVIASYAAGEETNLTNYLGSYMSKCSVYIEDVNGGFDAYVVGDMNYYLASKDGKSWQFQSYFRVKREDDFYMDNGLMVLLVV